MLGKRGLSPVVANVLIILLVIAAVAIVWAVVRPALENTGEQITTGNDCLLIDFEVTSCVATSPGTVTVKRNAGGAAGNVAFVLITPGGNFPNATGLDELGSVTLPINGAQGTPTLASGEEVSVAARLASGNLCNPTNEPVACQ